MADHARARNETLTALFKGLASEHRLHYLQAVGDEPLLASELAEKSGLSVQEVLRHLKQMETLGLVERGADRRYERSAAGSLVARTVGDLSDVAAADGLASDHDLSFVPSHLSLAPLFAFERSQAAETENVMRFLERAFRPGRVIMHAGTEIFWQPPGASAPQTPVLDTLRSWVGLYTPELARSEKLLERPRLLGESMPADAPLDIRISIVPDVPFILLITDQGSALFVRHRSGQMALGQLLIGERAPDAAWARALFAHWENTATLAFDTARGHTLDEWRARLLAAADAVENAPNGGPKHQGPMRSASGAPN